MVGCLLLDLLYHSLVSFANHTPISNHLLQFYFKDSIFCRKNKCRTINMRFSINCFLRLWDTQIPNLQTSPNFSRREELIVGCNILKPSAVSFFLMTRILLQYCLQNVITKVRRTFRTDCLTSNIKFYELVSNSSQYTFFG